MFNEWVSFAVPVLASYDMKCSVWTTPKYQSLECQTSKDLDSGSKHMKEFPISLEIRVLQIKTTMRRKKTAQGGKCTLNVRLAKRQETNNTKCRWWCGTIETHILAGGTSALEKTASHYRLKLKICVPYVPAFPVIRIFTRDMHEHMQWEAWMTCAAALFITARTWKQPHVSQ